MVKVTVPMGQPEAGVPVAPEHSQVLIVDADTSARGVLEVALRREGFKVDSASTPREAQKLMLGAVPSMVVVSADLNAEDGYSFCSRLRADARLATTRIVLLARADDHQRWTLAAAVGADEVITKPAFARDIAALAQIWGAAKDEHGASLLDTQRVPLQVAVRALLSTKRQGQLQLGPEEFIAFREGAVTHAHVGAHSGINALTRLLLLKTGSYRFTAQMPARPGELDIPLREWVEVVLARAQAVEASLAKGLPLSACLEVDFKELGRVLAQLPDSVNRVVRLFDGRRDLRQVLFDSGLSEQVTLDVAERLREMGVIRPTQAERVAAEPKPAPKFFEWINLLTDRPPMNELIGGEMLSAQNSGASVDSIQRFDEPQSALANRFDADSDNGGWVEQQLSAFQIRHEVELVTVSTDPDLKAFAAKGTLDDAPASHLESAAMYPDSVAPPAVEALEREFFARDGVGVSIVDEDEDDDDDEDEDEDEEPSSVDFELEQTQPSEVPVENSSWAWVTIGVLLLVASAAGLWVLIGDAGDPLEPLPVAEVKMLAAEKIPPVDEPQLVNEEVVVPTLTVSDADIQRALDEGTQQYERGEYADSIATLEQLVEVAPSSVNVWMLLAMARLDNLDSAGAEEAAKTVLALDEKHADAFLVLATAHIRQGQKELGAKEIGKYLELDPKGRHADEARRLLESKSP
jgi:CheY-like chemotaxis protein/tetratricopeptide (TPR) repeat protein